MWIVVGMANNQHTADQMLKALEAEGILVKLNNVSSSSKNATYEVLVLESESDSAREILLEQGF